MRTVFEQIRDKGRVIRGDIGIYAQTIDPILAQALNLTKTSGTILGDVFPNSTAEQAGLKTGDIVLSLGGKPMENGRQLTVNLYQKPVGERILMQVLRGVDTLEVSVEVVNRANDPGRFTDFVNAEKNLIPELGILVLDLDERLAEMFPNLRIRSGVVVAGRALDAPFWNEGFIPGDIIHQINGIEITSLSQFRDIVRNIERLEPVVAQVERNSSLFYLPFEKTQ